MAILDPQFKWGTEIEYNRIKVCNDEGSVLFEDKVNQYKGENAWLKINTEKTSFPERDCYDIEAIMGVFKGVETTNFMETCDFFYGILECIGLKKNFKCINPGIDKEIEFYTTEGKKDTFYGKPQLTISIDIAYYPRLFYLYFNDIKLFPDEMLIYEKTKKLMTSTNTTRDLTIFGFILYTNYVIYCISYYISFHNSIIKKMICVCERKEEYSEYSSFRKEIKKDKNGIELLDSIITAEGDLTDFIQYLNLDERYHYFLKEYIKNKSLFLFYKEDFDIFFEALILYLKSNKIYDKELREKFKELREKFKELREKFKEEVKLFIEFYEDLPKDETTNAFIKNIKLISSNSFILRFIKFQESWSSKAENYIKTFFHIKPRTKIQRLWKGMSTEYKDSIKSMVKSDMSISFMHRNEITTLETVINRLKKGQEISNFFETHDVYELFEFKDEQNSDYQVTVEFRDFLMLKELSGLIGLSPQEQKRQIITIKEFKESINYIFTRFLSRLFTPDSDPEVPPVPPEPRSLSSRPSRSRKKQKVKKVEVEEVEEGPEVPPVPPESRSLSSRPSRSRIDKKRKNVEPEVPPVPPRSLSSRPAPADPRKKQKVKKVEPEVEMSFKSKKIKSPKKSNSKTKKSKTKSKKSKKSKSNSKTKSKKSKSNSKTKSKKSKTKSKKSNSKTKTNSK